MRAHFTTTAAVLAALFLNGQSASAFTVKEYRDKVADTRSKTLMEMYAMGVGQGFFDYNVMLKVVAKQTQPLFCPPEHLPFTGCIVLSVTKDAVEKAPGDREFEFVLANALMRTFPCK